MVKKMTEHPSQVPILGFCPVGCEHKHRKNPRNTTQVAKTLYFHKCVHTSIILCYVHLICSHGK